MSAAFGEAAARVLTRRWLRVAVGLLWLLWLLDGIPQAQPVMFSSRFSDDVLRPAGAGQPLPVRWLVDWFFDPPSAGSVCEYYHTGHTAWTAYRICYRDAVVVRRGVTMLVRLGAIIPARPDEGMHGTVTSWRPRPFEQTRPPAAPHARSCRRPCSGRADDSVPPIGHRTPCR